MQAPGLIHVELVRAAKREAERRHSRLKVEPRGGPPSRRRWRWRGT